ncbi:MAG: type III secretion system export apparatus subunit SctS [Methylibium sp.]|nr:type III secretion system export apparatus subunit SctS [Methylibium sp.]MBA3623765.1 type III secretion system export apparatus subunit SctS [Methylibium sp.]
MDTANLLEFTNRGLLLALWVSLPTVAAAAAVGLFVAVVQATTQLQNQTASQVFKLIAACIVLALTARWVGVSILNFADEMMRSGGFHAPAPIL